MEHPFKECGLFATPKSMDELNAHLKNYSDGEGMAAAMLHGLTWNFLVEQFTAWLESQKPQPVTIIWGVEATRLYEDGETRISELEKVGSVETYHFSTPEDEQQAMQLWADSEGWENSIYVEEELVP